MSRKGAALDEGAAPLRLAGRALLCVLVVGLPVLVAWAAWHSPGGPTALGAALLDMLRTRTKRAIRDWKLQA